MRNDYKVNFIGWCLFVLFVGFVCYAFTMEYRLNRLERPCVDVTPFLSQGYELSGIDSHGCPLVSRVVDTVGWSRECMSYDYSGSCVHYIYVRWS